MFLRILEEGMRLDEVVTIDLGDDFPVIYDTLLFVASVCIRENIKFTVLTIPETEEYVKYVEKTGEKIGMFKFLAFHHVKRNGKVGYGWCGKQRWGTAIKRQLLNNFYQGKERFIVEYVGIAADEAQRVDITPHKNYAKVYPLIKWGMTERECLEYCYKSGIEWKQNGVRLYDILDRVSCMHCQQKNLKELRNIRSYMPNLWKDLMKWQEGIEFPYRSNMETVFDLENRFQHEYRQINMFENMHLGGNYDD